MSVLPDKYYNHSKGCKYCEYPNWVTCVECHNEHKMPHPYCCLNECGEHGFCGSQCTKGIYLERQVEK
jgi:hypothetical protein